MINDIDSNELLITYLRNLNHTMHSLYEGKGSQKRILIILNKHEKMTQHALTKKLGIKPSSVSEVIYKLEKAQLITRLPSQIDKRTSDITLTQRGKELAIEAQMQRDQRHKDMFTCLTDNEKKELVILLKKLDDDWKKYQKSDKNNNQKL